MRCFRSYLWPSFPNGKYLYFDNLFTSLRLLENLKLQNIKVCETIRPARVDIPSDFAKNKKNGTRRIVNIEQHCLHMDGQQTGLF